MSYMSHKIRAERWQRNRRDAMSAEKSGWDRRSNQSSFSDRFSNGWECSVSALIASLRFIWAFLNCMVAPLCCRRVKESVGISEPRWHRSQIMHFCSLKDALLYGPTASSRGGLGKMRCLITSLVGLCALVAAWASPARAAPLTSDWQHEQYFEAPAPGLVKLSLPPATLDAARPALEDLRLYDTAGVEVPYLIERPKPAGKITQAAKSFQVSVEGAFTVVTIESGLTQPIEGVTRETPARACLKAVQVGGSSDSERWQTLARGQPIFREPGGASQLHIAIPAGAWQRLRLNVLDQRSQPIPFTGARVHAAAVEPVPVEAVPVTIAGRDENPGETRLTLNLGAANLDVAAIQIDTTEPLFTRLVTVAVPQVAQDAIREQPLAHRLVYRVTVEGQP